MTVRAEQPTIKTDAVDLPELVDAALPIPASSTLCDDVRLEATGKLSIIGCYPGNVIVPNPVEPVTQLWVFIKLVWRSEFDPSGMRMRIDLPAQDPSFMTVQVNPSGLLSHNALKFWQVRFHPLRIGDLLKISVEQGAAHLLCGELLVAPMAKPTRH